MESTSSAEDRPQRAPRRRASSARSSESSETARRVPARTRATTLRKRAVRKTTETKAVAPKKAPPRETTEITDRKAPTPLAANTARKKSRRNQLVIAGTVVLLGVGSSAAVGYTDPGRIDVTSMLEESNSRVRNSGGDTTTLINVPVQNTNNLPNGGLVGFGDALRDEPAPVAPETSTSTATSTDSTATTTEALATSTDEVAAEQAPDAVEITSEETESETGAN